MRLVLALAVVVLVRAAAAAEGAPAEAALRARGDAFGAAMSAGTTQALEAFAREHLAPALAEKGLVGEFAAGRRSELSKLGAVTAWRTEVGTGGRLVLVYCRHGSTGAWRNYQFRVPPELAGRLQLVFIAEAVEPAQLPATPVHHPETKAWLAARLQSIETQQPFEGVALVRRRGEDVVQLVQGVADPATAAPITRATAFGMASGSKMFTAVAVLQLAQAGRLALDDSLAKHLPDFPAADFAKRTTLHQLLTHTAGAGDYWDAEYEKAWGGITTTEGMLPHVLRHLGDTPAGEFSYSNSGYVLLGLVIERVAGTSYFEHVKKAVLAPAGMTSTGFPLRAEGSAGRAVPCLPEREAGAVKRGSRVPVALGARGSSAGGASTTADDVLRFVAALSDGRLLDAKHRDLMLAPHVPYGIPDTWYGYGVVVSRQRGVRSWGHDGTARGTQFELEAYPDLDTVLVVLSAYDTIAPHELALALDGTIRNEKPPAAP